MFWSGMLLAVITGSVGKGLSQLQHDILAVLRTRPGWIRPKDILDALGREPTPSNRSAVSKALDRLCARELVELGRGEIMSAGKSSLYRWPRISRSRPARLP